MYIERVEIYGFKSFARKTELVFGPGLCVIMGPNGVGKSNILDAIRWAVGEQKLSLLRSSLLEDVIFDGSAGQKPASFAEVSVQFAEAEGLLPYDPKADRIKITRRVYRDGDSKFFINNVPMRLKDIRGILATVGLGDVGYAVLNEGMINKIIGGSTEDRRMLFEQAAGIAKYKSDKRATELKLKATRADLVRIEDIIRELSEQEAILRRQVYRYRRYKKLRGEIAELETKLYGSKLAALTAEIKQLQQALARQKDLYEKISGELAEVSSEIQKLAAQRRELETRRDRIFQQRNKISSEIGAREQEIAVLEERIRHARETIANYSENSAQLSRTIQKGREDIKNAGQLKQLAQKKIGEVEAEIKKIESEIDELSQKALKKRRELKEFEQDYEDLRRRIGEIDKNIAFARQENKKLAERLAEYERQIAEREKNIAEIEKSLRKYEQKLAELEGKREKFATDREKLSAEISELNEKIAQLRGQIVKYQNERAQTGGRIEELKRIVASGKDIGKNIAQVSRQPEKYGILGIVADMVEIEPEYSRVAEQIMGERVKFFVVETAADALAAVEKLPDNLGRVGFVILDELSPPENPPQWAKADDPRILALLDCAPTEEILPPPKGVAFSPDGKFVRRRGELIAQIGVAPAGAITVRAQLTQLNRKLEKINSALAELENELAQLERTASEKSVQEGQIRRQMEEISAEISQIRQSQATVSERYKNFTRTIEELKSAREQISAQIEKNHENLKKWESQSAALSEKYEKILAEREKIEGDIEQISATIRQRENQISALTIERVNAENDLRSAENEISRAKLSIEQAQQQIAELEKSVRQARETIFVSEGKIADLKGEIEKLFARRERLQSEEENLLSEIEKLSRRISELRRRESELASQREKTQVEIAQIEGKIDGAQKLYEQIRREGETNLGFSPEEGEILPEEELQKIQTRIQNKRRQLEQYGGADEEIEEQYERVRQRLEFLNKQKEDITESISDLKATIRRLDSEARRLFMETFAQAREKFKQIFGQLFEGGEADLSLVDEDDPLTSDIAIKVKPAGKKTLSLTQLSAGEKALTALALLFGLYLVKPAPFCMMDEVDAPLDDANVERFLKLVRTFSKDIQFIIVSHNTRTLENADYLYGVSMEKDGVSRVFSVKMSDLQLQFE